ncbi:MAG: prepilin peptidase [bacterium]|nr:prepilin peptidase [bacterium]
MSLVESGILFIFGTIVGSFLNVCIYRLPRNQSIVKPRRSHCPNCGETIKAVENIPLISFLWLKGKCCYCGAGISWRYPAVELLTGLIYLLVGWKLGLSYYLVFPLFFVSALIAITFIDLEHFLILDKITYPSIIIGLLATKIPGQTPDWQISFWPALIGMVVGGGAIYFLLVISPFIFGKEGMGGGDVKLAALMGVFLGWQKVFLALFFGAAIGSVVGLSLIGLGRAKRGEYIPFGPFLALGALVVLLQGDEIIRWYLGIADCGLRISD